jgi:hypothetical protein
MMFGGMSSSNANVNAMDSSMNSMSSSATSSSSTTTTTNQTKNENENQNPFESVLSSSSEHSSSSNSSSSSSSSYSTHDDYTSNNNNNCNATFYLNAAVDHYTQAYELMTRFRLEDIVQYTFLMAMMNNLAITYGSLNQPTRVDVCNKYLVQSLILVICSSERDGHLGQEVLSLTDDKSVLRKEEDRTIFESFLSNVMYLMMGTQRCNSGNTIAPAA